MTDAIEKLLTLFEIDFAERGVDSVALQDSPGGRFVDGQMVSAARAELAALRAENEAQARQIAALREALETIQRQDVHHSGAYGAFFEFAEEVARKALAAIPAPSSMRLVPLERLREIEDLLQEERLRIPDWLAAAIAGKDTQ